MNPALQRYPLERDGLRGEQMIWRILIFFVLFVCSMHAQTLRKVAVVDLLGPKGQRFDYLTMDDEDHWLLTAHLGPAFSM